MTSTSASAVGVDPVLNTGPPLVFLPSERMHAGDEQASVLLRDLAGTPSLVGFLGLDALVASCGPDQPWVALELPAVRALADDCSAVVLLDPGPGVWGAGG